MTYAFPPSLKPLNDYLVEKGADVAAFKGDRQAAFIAQELLGSFIKFPPKGADMASTLFLIQKAIPGYKPKIVRAPWQQAATVRKKVPGKGNKSNADPQRAFNGRSTGVAERKAALREKFAPETFASGLHIFCDGAAVPNPGAGGWGVAVYRDGVEIDAAFGGDAEATNNQMELAGILNALEAAKRHSGTESFLVTIWTDSKYCVNGCNTWRHGWKKHGWKKQGWNRKGPNSPKRSDETAVKNPELWKAIDAALSTFPDGTLKINWVKGHAGVAGNERADELAELGRQAIINGELSILDEGDELDARYREIMGAA